jgi:carbamoyltransferase
MSQKQHDYILGLNVYDHDVSACLLRDGEIAYAIAKERITREKHASGFYQEVIDYCLKAEGIALDDVSLIVRNCYILPVGEMEKRLLHQEMPYYFDAEERKQASRHPLFLSASNKVVTVSHHLAHAYAAFAVCPFDEGVIMVVDGVGSYRSDVCEPVPSADIASPMARESESYYRFSGGQLETLKKIWMEPSRGFLNQEFYTMPGLGALYSRVSIYVFGDWNKCGEVMGLAPYGRAGRIEPLVYLKADEQVAVPEWTKDFNQPWQSLAGQSWEQGPAMQHWEDLAWRAQDDAEKILLARAKWLRETTGAKNLCIVGGVALNCVANGRIAREAGFDNVWVQPAAGDDGIAIGCAYYGHLALAKKSRAFTMKHAYLGVDYRDDDIRGLLNRPTVRLVTKTRRSDNVCADTARVLADGQIVGWFQGRSEFGPRALGNRSILADPRQAGMKDHLNKRVKHRQSFRPFAPIVLAEREREIFEGDTPSPFMLIAKPVRPEWRDKIPAIVHVDGTARVQSVTQDQNPLLYKLLKEFEALTGVPVLLNTSFNVKGEPIVETPGDALACFLGTGIDCLVMHDWLITKGALHGVLSPLIQIYSDVGAIVRTGLGQPAGN